ncbi:precorrin-2/cobalt-factor-2 C20-methyltransferase [Ruminococcus sp. YE71]|uniref:precorrin-2 C(20)-methyltransferase n=1 Tax=unclassified Ruminococcus TaxID=2608920 RepID=UPI0008825A11|nr:MULTISPECIES: precorrin-2 C(20)-methyltransferase [unclassified Ruminococcus]SDA20763.1 precorrin-2/cobalt-factor-2 C20-methyltransferase [Ruminococcus sp. YE78]SFW33676.1 precorrin-2/cobalt-factor-2 C20-methyltransferase [Ruminococcus sp. YE71]
MLYGVSVGCGDPLDMTIKAVRTIERCDTVFVPRTGGEKSLALRIASGAVDMSAKQLIHLDFPMTRDTQELENAWDSASETVCEVLREGDAAMICLGDVSIYTTFSYISGRVEAKGFETKWLPGASSVTAAACAANIPLVCGNEPLHILPYGCEGFSEMLAANGTKVIMKCGKKAPQLLQELEERGMLESCIAVENAGLENERVTYGRDIPADVGYFTVFILR